MVLSLRYDSFGNVLEDTNPALTLPFGFAGGLYDPDTGLLRFGFRDYDPDVGRWTAKDPIGFAGGDTDVYGYCVGDPISAVDPEGLLIIKMGFGGQIGAGWGDNSWYGGVSYARYFTLEECGETQGNVVKRMLVLPVTAPRSSEYPSVSFKQFDDIAHLGHAHTIVQVSLPVHFLEQVLDRHTQSAGDGFKGA